MGGWQRDTQPVPLLPGPACPPPAEAEQGDPRGQQEGEQNRPKFLLKAAAQFITGREGKAGGKGVGEAFSRHQQLKVGGVVRVRVQGAAGGEELVHLQL